MKQHLVGKLQRAGGPPENVELVVDRRPIAELLKTITDQDATPSVLSSDANRVYKTANTVATTITDFDDGFVGQVITVIIGDANTTVDFTSSGLIGNGGVDWSPASGDHMNCVYDGTDWYCDVVGTATSVTQTKYKTADESRASTTTFADDTHLTGFTIEADAYYAIRGAISVVEGGGDFKLQLQHSQTPQAGDISLSGHNQNGTAIGDSASIGGQVSLSMVSGVTYGLVVHGFIRGHATTDSTMDVQWAQLSSNVANTTVHEGSYIQVEKLS